MLSNTFKQKYDEQLERLTDYQNDVRFSWRAYKYSRYGGFLFFGLLIIMVNLQIQPSVGYVIFSLEWFFTYLSSLLFLFVPIIYVPSRYIVKRKRKKHNHNEIRISFIYMYDALKSYENWSDKNVERDKDKSLDYLRKSYKIIERWNYDKSPLFTKDIKDNMKLVQYNLKNFLLNRMLSVDNGSKSSSTIQILYRLNSFLYYNNYESFKELIDYVYTYEKELKKGEYDYVVDRFKIVANRNKNLTYGLLVVFICVLYYVLSGYANLPHSERVTQIVNFLVFYIIAEGARRFIYDEKYEEKR